MGEELFPQRNVVAEPIVSDAVIAPQCGGTERAIPVYKNPVSQAL